MVMNRLELQNKARYDLVSDEVLERRDCIQYQMAIPEDKTLEELEADFLSAENTEIVHVLDSKGEITRSISGYTKYKSLEKTKDMVVIKMTLPDWKEKYDELKKIVDQLVEDKK